MELSRRDFLRIAGAGAGAVALSSVPVLPTAAPSRYAAFAAPLTAGLSDPALQPKFTELVPNALDPGFLFKDLNERGGPASRPNFRLRARQTVQQTGLIEPKNGRRLTTPVWGYGDSTVSWPGQTFQVTSASAGGADETTVRWENELPNRHLLPVDENLHWAYSLHDAGSANGVDYRQYSIRKNGVPMITHLHGGNTDFQYDGNPEFFYGRQGLVTGPQWDFVDGGFTNTFRYDNAVPAGNLWYHDHTLGITRLNVYAGLAGFYFVRDEVDTGTADNPLGLPAFPYELAYAIQDRMFTDRGALFYPAFPGDPFYAEFITEQGIVLDPALFPGGGPTALAEFFGDHMVVNGKIWPKADVEPRNYRMHLLNGCDSRFLVTQFVAVNAGATDPSSGTPVPFWVIGSDQGLGTPAQTDTLVIEPGGRYDVVVDFSQVPAGSRVILKNLGGDAPFGGAFGDDLDPDDTFVDRQTDRIMAFDVVVQLSDVPDDFDPNNLSGYGGVGPEDRTRRVALFEGTDEFGRLQPLLGTVANDISGTNVATAYTWFQPPTETPTAGDTEIWEVYNFTADAHPIHLHLVNFEILDRQDFEYDITGTQTTTQHNGTTGDAPEISNIRNLTPASVGSEYFENAPKDMVTALPGDPDGAPPTGQMVRIKADFTKSGRYVWHCHILSHEDHEMMRVLQVG
ncbi:MULTISPECIES: multicopper oxidase family protein [unclassified Isoptericola]|uniref:multicopper oxidase family protein n=1 Tax=unclassified Isoptericola TaxID=2623355 RepID=UPI0027129C25|nr:MULTISPECIES: multicopper oxidase domain-containing protein [unclassified Isoptericola]MDO8143414.1 multicopper oxidase domain-containing protein [Isoptericola sp. 178]MDO8150410.1 multicopper oxidase domain-containing protein [Isoptericola sp. b408]